MILFTYLCRKICLLLNTPTPVGTTLRCRRNSHRFEAVVPEKKFPNRTMGFGGRQYQKTTLASNPKGDYPATYGLFFYVISFLNFQNISISEIKIWHTTFQIFFEVFTFYYIMEFVTSMIFIAKYIHSLLLLPILLWLNGQCARPECGRSWVRASVGSNNQYVLLLH